mmetsp:Transcript_25554/g.53969  ORF Transcript_25554/g.53969 Transcript_25554/m.53969 type:complete len:83 (-) Transcript_25554:316-564(-)
MIFNRDEGGQFHYKPPPGSRIRAYFTDLMEPHIVGDGDSDWTVTEDFVESNNGWCIPPEMGNNKLFPLLVHSYLQQAAMKQL